MLDKDKLEQDIRKLNDSSYEFFVGFPPSCVLATERWADAFYLYVENIIPVSNTILLAKQAFKSSLLSICSSSSFEESVAIFTSAIMNLAQAIIPGFIVSQFTGVMPSLSLNLIPIFRKSMNGGSAYDFAVELSSEVDTWFKSGTAININSGVTINWK